MDDTLRGMPDVEVYFADALSLSHITNTEIQAIRDSIRQSNGVPDSLQKMFHSGDDNTDAETTNDSFTRTRCNDNLGKEPKLWAQDVPMVSNSQKNRSSGGNVNKFNPYKDLN